MRYANRFTKRPLARSNARQPLRRAAVEAVEQRLHLSATLQVRPVDASGKPGTPVTFQSPAGVLVEDFTPEQQSLLATGFAAPDYDLFLEIDGIEGSSPNSKHEDAIDLEALSWGADSILASTGGGAGGAVGRSEFHELHAVSRVSAASTELIRAMTTGLHHDSAHVWVRRSGETQAEFAKLELENVLVSSYQVTTDAAGLVEEFTLSFDQAKLEFVPQRADGSSGSPVVYQSPQGLDVQPFVPDERPLLDAGYATPSSVDLRLEMQGVAEESKAAIDVLSFSWAADHVTGSTSGGGGSTGRTDYQELHVVTRLSERSALLVDRLATGVFSSTASLVARRSDGTLTDVYKINLQDVTVSSYQVRTDADGVVEEFTLHFDDAAFETRFSAFGSPVVFNPAPESFAVRDFGPPQRSVLDAGVMDPSSADFFLHLDGVTGDSFSKGHEGDIDVVSFSWGGDAVSAGAGGGGTGAGRTDYQELHVVTRSSIATPQLLERLADGLSVGDGELVGRRDGKEQAEFLTLDLEDVFVSSYQLTTAPDGTLLEEYTLSFDRMTGEFGISGTSTAETFDTGPDAFVDGFGPRQTSLLQDGFTDLAAFDVFLDLDGIPGESAKDGHKEEIEILSFSWGAEQPGGVSSGGGGAGTSRPQFQELHVAARISKASPLVMDRMTTGFFVPGGTLSVVRAGDKGGNEVMSIDLDDVTVSSYQVTPRNGELVEEFTLAFRQATLGVPAGLSGVDTEFVSPTLAVVEDFTPPERSLLQSDFGPLTGATEGFLRIDGIAGESNADKRVGQIDVLSFSWGGDLTRSSVTSGSGGAVGRAALQELRFVTHVSKATPLLLDRMAKGLHIPSAEVSFLRAGKEQTQILKIDLDDVQVFSHQILPGPDGSLLEEFSLVFAEAEAKFGPPNTAVTYTKPQEVGIDVFAPPQVSLLDLGRDSSGPYDMFLTVDGAPGDSTASKQAGAIDVLSFSWGGHQSDSVGSGTGGAGTGRSTLQDLHVITRFGSASPRLVDLLATGLYAEDAKLSVRRAGATQAEVLSISLADVQVSSYRVTTAVDGTLLEEYTLHFAAGTPGDNTAPTATVVAVAPDPRLDPVDSIEIRFSELIAGFDIDDLSLTRNGSPVPLGGGQTLQSSDGGRTWTLGGLAPLTLTRGTYQLTLTAQGSDVSDASGNLLTADASESWVVQDHSPVANDDAAETPEDQTVTVAVLANDADADGDALTVTNVGPAGHGTVTLNANGTVTYSPDLNFHGTDTFTYAISDGAGGTDTAAVTLTVTPVNDAPVANPAAATVAEDGSVAVTLGASDVETPVAQLTFTVTRLPAHGLLTAGTSPVAVGDTFTGPPTLTYTPTLCVEPGTDSFAFTVTDTGDPAGTAFNALTSAEAAVTLAVTPAVPNGSLSLANGVLRIGGTPGADTINVTRSGANVVVSGAVNGTLPAAQVTEVRVWSRGGNDTVNLNVDLPSFVSGGAGNDNLNGGGADDLLLGGDGADTLSGGAGDDVLIGGRQSDRLVGAAGDDVLIGGHLDCRFTLAAVRALGATWSATQVPVPALRLSGPTPDVTDTEFDQLTGASGADWFVVSSTDKATDAKPGKKDDAVSALP